MIHHLLYIQNQKVIVSVTLSYDENSIKATYCNYV
ncbi:Uncharacterised protein [Klebsiella pneumoniae]|nr:Uncharacterised protein [Klebsiella pneumoniae]